MTHDDHESKLEGRPLALYRAIKERDVELARRYIGVKIAFASEENPEYLAQSAHSARELMDNLHRITDVPVKAEVGRLGDRFAVMVSKWEKGQRHSHCYVDGRWSGVIDPALARAIAAVEETIEWARTHRPRRKEVLRTTIQGLDVSGRSLPALIEEAHVNEWDRLRTYFIDVCHHRRNTTPEECAAALEKLERSLLLIA